MTATPTTLAAPRCADAEERPAGEPAAAGRPLRPDLRKRTLSLAAFGVVAFVIGQFASEFWVDIANLACIAAIAAIGLDLLLGHTGLVSAGNAAFLGIGALTVALLNQDQSVPMVVSLLAAGSVCAVIGVIVALPSLRISGLYLAAATLAFHFIAVWAIREIQTGQVGDSGFVIPVGNIFGFELFDLFNWYYFLVLLLGVVMLLQRGLLHRKPGRALHAIRERPALAEMSGISVVKYKVAAFAMSSFLVGLSGGLTAYYVGNVSYTNFALHLAIEYLAIVIVGGLGSTYGPVIGAAFVISLPNLVKEARKSFGLGDVISSTDIFFVQGSIVGLITVAVIILQPRGLVGIGAGIKDFVARKIGGRS